MARLGTTSRHATYACGVGAMHRLRSFLRRDATRVHIILTNLRQKRYPVSWTLLVVIIPLNHHPGLCSFTCTRGRPFGVRGHDHLTSRSTRRVFTWRAWCPTWSSCKRKTEYPGRLSLESVCCLTACPTLSSTWPSAFNTCVSFGLSPREGANPPDRDALPARGFSSCPN